MTECRRVLFRSNASKLQPAVVVDGVALVGPVEGNCRYTGLNVERYVGGHAVQVCMRNEDASELDRETVSDWTLILAIPAP